MWNKWLQRGGVLLLGVIGVTGLATMAVSANHTGLISACVDKGGGIVITTTDSCPNNKTLLSWNKAGAVDQALEARILALEALSPPTLSVNDISQYENSGLFVFTISISKAPRPGQPVSFSYGVSGGTASSGVDFLGGGDQTSFSAGDSLTKSMPVYVAPDTTLEGDETFVVQISGVTGAILLKNLGIGTILNDD